MTQSSTFPHLLNEIFSDLISESNITIDYRGYPCAVDDNEDIQDIRILSVNGFQKPGLYYDRIRYLCAKLVGNLIQTLAKFGAEDRRLFMEDALDMFDPLLSVVTYEHYHPRFFHQKEGDAVGIHLFTNPNFIGDKYHEAPYYLYDRILCRAWKYSYSWFDAISSVYDKLGTLIILIEHLPPQHDDVRLSPPVKPLRKLRFAGTVPQLACFARILEENLFFSNINKSEICRVFIDTFQTKGADDIHWKSFKNNFDCPPLDAILFWQEECRKTMQNLQILIKKYAA